DGRELVFAALQLLLVRGRAEHVFIHQHEKFRLADPRDLGVRYFLKEFHVARDAYREIARRRSGAAMAAGADHAAAPAEINADRAIAHRRERDDATIITRLHDDAAQCAFRRFAVPVERLLAHLLVHRVDLLSHSGI